MKQLSISRFAGCVLLVSTLLIVENSGDLKDSLPDECARRDSKFE